MTHDMNAGDIGAKLQGDDAVLFGRVARQVRGQDVLYDAPANPFNEVDMRLARLAADHPTPVDIRKNPVAVLAVVLTVWGDREAEAREELAETELSRSHGGSDPE